MPRDYKRRTARTFPETPLKQAVLAVVNGNLSIRKSAETYGVKKSTLYDYVKKYKVQGIESVVLVPNFKIRQILSDEMESSLADYLVNCSNMFYGLSPKAVRRLAYEYAVQNSVKIPQTWHENAMAGRDWFSGFLHRHSALSIRKPEATSLARMTSFNKHNIQSFFDKLETVMQRYGFAPGQIYNLDEVIMLLTCLCTSVLITYAFFIDRGYNHTTCPESSGAKRSAPGRASHIEGTRRVSNAGGDHLCKRYGLTAGLGFPKTAI